MDPGGWVSGGREILRRKDTWPAVNTHDGNSIVPLREESNKMELMFHIVVGDGGDVVGKRIDFLPRLSPRETVNICPFSYLHLDIEKVSNTHL